MINITLPDGSQRQVEKGTTALDVAMGISEGLLEMFWQPKSMVRYGTPNDLLMKTLL